MSEAGGVAAAMVMLALGGLWVVLKPDAVERELEGRWPLAKKRLCGGEQLAALEELQAELPGMRVMSGVSLSRMLYVEPCGCAREMRERTSFWAEKKSRNSVDFVICDRQGGIVAAVDMLGSNQLKGARARAQAEKERMLEAAGIFVFNLASMSAAAVGRAIRECSSANESVGSNGHGGGNAGAGVVPHEAAQRQAAGRRDLAV